MLRAFQLFLTALACIAPVVANAQAVYHLHKEASSTSGLFQLITAVPDGTSLAIQSIDLENQPRGEYVIKQLDTQAGVPNATGYIPSYWTVSFTLCYTVCVVRRRRARQLAGDHERSANDGGRHHPRHRGVHEPRARARVAVDKRSDIRAFGLRALRNAHRPGRSAATM